MNISISGATGFIGSYLTSFFSKQGHTVIPLGREVFLPQNRQQLFELISQSEVVINLAGAPINHRWTDSYKNTLYESRIKTTRKLVEAIRESSRTQLFISTSAVGYYSDTGCHDEASSQQGTGLLADLCEKWEKEAHNIPSHVRLVITRFGVVLDFQGGAFKELIRSVPFKITATIGNGKQYFSWIDIKDLARAISHLIKHTELEGIFNLVAPQYLTQKELTQNIAQYYHTYITISIPHFLLQILYGEASTLFTQGQCVIPKRLIQSGFNFRTPTITQFLESTKRDI